MIGQVPEQSFSPGGRVFRVERLMALCVAVATLAFAAPQTAEALTIVPIFNSGLTASSQLTINTAIAFYESTFSDPITVTIGFANEDSGLGENESFLASESYHAVSTALVAHRTSADDNAANYTIASVDPVLGKSNIFLKTANARALGFNVAGGTIAGCGPVVLDGCVFLNLGITTDATPGGYDLLSVVEHEMDEVLGLGSSLQGDGTIFENGNNEIMPEDLFRYASAGVRSFALNSCSSATNAFFSIDGGVTDIDQFHNCTDGADYGDWVTHSTPQVQDGTGTEGTTQSLTVTDPAVRALDVIGYTLATDQTTTPEPATLPLIATGFATLAGAGWRRRRGMTN